MDLNSEPKCTICYQVSKTSTCTQCFRILSSAITGLTVIHSNPFGHIENLVFQGGGVKGVAYLGALKQLERESDGFLQRIKRVAGSSAGSLMALYLALNLPLGKIRDLVIKKQYKDFLDHGLGLEINGEKKKVRAKLVFLKGMEYFKLLAEELKDEKKRAEAISKIKEITRDTKDYYTGKKLRRIPKCLFKTFIRDYGTEFLTHFILDLFGYSNIIIGAEIKADNEIVFEEELEKEFQPIDHYETCHVKPIKREHVVEPHTFIKEVEVVETRPSLKEIEVIEPVKVVKDVYYTKAVPVKKQIEIVEPQVVTKEVEVIEPKIVTKAIQVTENVPVEGQTIEPRLVTKNIQFIENVPVKRQVEVVEMRKIVQEVETLEPQTFHKQIEVTEYVPHMKQVEVIEPVTLKKAVEFVEPVITTQTITKEMRPAMQIPYMERVEGPQPAVIIDEKITTEVGPATVIGDIVLLIKFGSRSRIFNSPLSFLLSPIGL